MLSLQEVLPLQWVIIDVHKIAGDLCVHGHVCMDMPVDMWAGKCTRMCMDTSLYDYGLYSYGLNRHDVCSYGIYIDMADIVIDMYMATSRNLKQRHGYNTAHQSW